MRKGERIIKRLFVTISVLCALSLAAMAQTATVTVHLADPSNSNVTSRTFLRVELKNTAGQQCRVAGSGLIVPTVKDVSPDSNGNISTSLIKTSSITCGSSTGNAQWAFTIWRDGKPQPSCFLQVTGNLDLTSAVCLNSTSTPVTVAPTDAIFMRLDAVNSPAQPWTFTGLTVTGTTTLNGTAIPVIGIDPTAAAYGCSTGATDNSTCLQAAINAAIAANTCVVLPPGTFTYATTLTANSTTKGACIIGKGGHPTLGSITALKYTGASDALSISNGTGSVYRGRFEHIAIVAGANATSAVNGTNMSEWTFDDVGIWSDGTHQFTHGWFGTGWNICTWRDWTVESVTNAVRFTSSAQLNLAALHFYSGNTFTVTNVFNIDGSVNQIEDVNGWHETQDTVLLVDDATNATNIVGFYFIGGRQVFNGAIATYPNSVALKVNNAAGKVMTIHQLGMLSMTWSTNQAVAYPVSITLGNASSLVYLGIGGNSSFVGATTGLVNSSLVAASQLKFNGNGFESLNASFSNLGTLLGGSSGQFTDSEFSGITSNQNAVFNSATSFVSVGVNPAASGMLRIPNNVNGVVARNAANSGDVNIVGILGDNRIFMGPFGGSTDVDIFGAVRLGASSDASVSRTAAATVAIGNGTAGDSSGTLKAAKLNNGGDLTIPNATDTLVGKATTDTLTHKTLNGATSGNSVVNLASLKQDATAQLTGNSADQTVWTFSVPGGTIESGTAADFDIWLSHDVGTATITFKLTYGSAVVSCAVGGTAVNEIHLRGMIANNNSVTNAQRLGLDCFTTNTTNAGTATGAVDTTASQTLTFSFNVANTDKITGHSLRVLKF